MSKQPTSFRLSDLTTRQLAALIAATGMTQSEVMSTAIDRMYQQEIKNMNSQLKVESAIERSLGKAGGIGDERFEIRFWLSTEINGKKVDSRGTVVKVERPSLADARKWMQQIAFTLSGKILNNQWTAKDAKEANAAFAGMVNEAIAEDAEFHAAFNSFAE